ncbi:uncharacterized protein TNCT_500041 [Trichonephila clavata]|uniref:Uncharacterized protein n=1 Tax=Trichonephila clavata TaxID=2740835 RepID=A0A8X6HU21_TRICU|nr:uncharacterized protein TNCT_500041 [Trichonephila clavata]
MALHITHVHSPSDCDFCNRRTIGQSVPDLTVACYGTSPPNRSLVPKSPRDTPVSSPMRAKTQRQNWLATGELEVHALIP